MRRNEQHWLLNDADARTYGTAIANAMRHLPIGATQKAIDFSALLICAINMETPRVYQSMRTARARRHQQQQQTETEAPGGATVYAFTRPSSPPPQPAPPAGPSGVVMEGFTGDGIDAPIGGH